MNTAAHVASEARLLARVLGVGGILLLLLVTAATLSFATTCSLPVDSLPHTGIFGGVGAALRRIEARRAAAAAAGSGEPSESSSVVAARASAMTIEELARHVDEARALLAALDKPGGEDALGGSAGIARALAQGVLDVSASVVEAAARVKVEPGGSVGLDAWASRELFTQQTCYVSSVRARGGRNGAALSVP
jgi:hypothetical protein